MSRLAFLILVPAMSTSCAAQATRPTTDVTPSLTPTTTTAPATTQATSGTPDAVGAAAPRPAENLDVGPTLVSLDLTNVPARQAFEELSRLANVPFEYSDQTASADGVPAPDSTVTVRADGLPLLLVLHDLCRQAGYDPYPTAGESIGLVRVPRPPAPGAAVAPAQPAVRVTANTTVDGRVRRRVRSVPAAAPGRRWSHGRPQAVGPFLVSLTGVEVLRAVDLTSPTESQVSLGLTMIVMAEPKVRVLDAASQFEVRELLDDRGRPMARARPAGTPMHGGMHGGGMYAGPATRLWPVAVSIPVARDARTVTVRGAVRATAVSRTESLTVADVLKAAGQEKRLGDIRVTITDVQEQNNGAQYAVDAGIFRDAMDEQQWHRTAHSLHQFAPTLRDADGVALRRQSYGDPSGRGDDYRSPLRVHRSTFTARGGERPRGPVSLTWELPTMAKPIAIPVEFVGVPVP